MCRILPKSEIEPTVREGVDLGAGPVDRDQSDPIRKPSDFCLNVLDIPGPQARHLRHPIINEALLDGTRVMEKNGFATEDLSC